MGQLVMAFYPETLNCSFAKYIYMRTLTRGYIVHFLTFYFNTASQEVTFKKCCIGDSSLLYRESES